MIVVVSQGKDMDKLYIFTKEQLKSEFERYSLFPDTAETLDAFGIKKSEYLTNNDAAIYAELATLFQTLDSDLKMAKSVGMINENDFIYLRELLREGL